MAYDRDRSQTIRRLLTPDDVNVIAVLTDPPPTRVGSGTWPCPFCGLHRPLDSATQVRIRNRTGPSLERTIAACNSCLPQLRDPDTDEASSRHRSPQARVNRGSTDPVGRREELRPSDA